MGWARTAAALLAGAFGVPVNTQEQEKRETEGQQSPDSTTTPLR